MTRNYLLFQPQSTEVDSSVIVEAIMRTQTVTASPKLAFSKIKIRGRTAHFLCNLGDDRFLIILSKLRSGEFILIIESKFSWFKAALGKLVDKDLPPSFRELASVLENIIVAELNSKSLRWLTAEEANAL